VRQLEVVGVSDDGTHVLLASAADADRPSHQLPIDDRLQAAVRGDLASNGSERAGPALSPKEIQSRLRAGDSPETVAKAAKTPLTRVMRYAGPVLSERDLIVEQARAARLTRPRGKPSTVSLGELVDGRIATVANLRPDSVAWSARRRDDGAWVVEVTYHARGNRSAAWLWQPATHELTALDVAGARLAAEASAPKRRSPRKQPGKKATATRKTTSARRRTTQRPLAVVEELVRETPAPPPRPSLAEQSLSADGRLAETAAAGDAASRRRTGRVAVPSWSDVLLGTQHDREEPAPPAGGSGSTRRGRRRS